MFFHSRLTTTLCSITRSVDQFAGGLRQARVSNSTSRFSLATGFLALLLLAGAASAASPFTYQGRLNSPGGPANGTHDFEFGLYSSAGGSDQIATTVSLSGVTVDGGLFSVQLDFGDGSFDAPNRWLDIAVRPGGSGDCTPLSPRQPLTPAPSAHHAFSIADGSVTAAKVEAGAVGTPALDLTVSQALVPAGSHIMTTSVTPPPGYTFTGRRLSTSDADGWSVAKQPMPTAREGLAAVAVNGRLYTLGGSIPGYAFWINEEFDPATNTWATKAPMPTEREGLAAAAVNGKVYAVGGNNAGGDSSANEEYDPATNTWATKAPMPTARRALAAAAINGKIYAVGGYNESLYSSANEEYDPATNTWSTKTAMPTARYLLAAAAVNDKLYVIGGLAESIAAPNEEYDPATNAWATKAAMPTNGWGLAAAAINGKLYAVGGYTGTAFSSANEEYDPAANTWSTKPDMPTARSYFAVAAVNGKLYAVGGSQGSSYYSVNEEYTPPDPASATLYVHRKD